MRKLVPVLILIMLLACILPRVLNIQQVEAGGTIYIRIDGSVDPVTAPILSVDNVTYTLIANINNDSIVVERDDIVVDGAGYTIQGFGSGLGIDITGRSNVTVRNMDIRMFDYGIYLYGSADNNISENKIGDAEFGIYSDNSSNNTFYGNNITNTNGSLIVNFSENCTILKNHVSNSTWGLSLYGSQDCRLQGNIMFDNLYNFGINGECLADFSNYIDSSNTVNGKSVYYLTNQSNLEINPSTYPNLGYLALINSTEVAIENLNITQNYHGLLLVNTNNSKISNLHITKNFAGIIVYLSSNVTVETSTILENAESGIYVGYSENSTIVSNNVTGHIAQTWSNGIELYHSENIAIVSNNIIDNKYGMFLYYSNNNSVYWNNFIENIIQADTYSARNNRWDNGYPSGGNYWSDYSGYDANNDGVADQRYWIEGRNQDNYPLMGRFSSFNASLGHYVNVISNSTIGEFKYFEFNSTIRMRVSNMTNSQTFGFCRIRIPHALMNETFHVTIDGAEPAYVNYTLFDDGVTRWIYFSYEHSTLEIIIVPELLHALVLPLFMMTTILAAMIYRKRRSNRTALQ